MHQEPSELARTIDTLIKNAGGRSEESNIGESVSSPSLLNGYGVEANEGGDVHLRDYWRLVRKRLWLVLVITILVSIATIVFFARQPDIFQAEVRLQINRESAGAPLSASKNTPIIFNNETNDPTYLNTQIQILTSPALLRRVVKTLDLEHNRAFLHSNAQSSGSTWQSLLRMVGLGDKNKAQPKDSSAEALLSTSSVAPATSREDLVEAMRLEPFIDKIQADLTIERVVDPASKSTSMETRLVDVRYKHSDPQLAAKIVNAIADAFVLQNLEKRTETNTSTGDFLQKRIAELQSQIRTGEERLINYATDNQILSLDASQNTVVERLAGLNRQLLEAENDRKAAEAAYRAALAPNAAAALAENDAKNVSELEGKLADLRQKRAQLLVENTEEWPEVKETNQQIASIEMQLKDLRTRATANVLTNLETRYRQALAKEQSLREAFNQQRGATLTQNAAAINYRIIQQEIETNKGLLNGLMQGSKENEVVLAGTPNNVFVVDYALIPKVAVGPKRLQALALAFLLSLAFGIGLAIFLEYMNDTLRSSEDVEKLLHLPALGVIPAIGGLTRRRFLPAIGALERHSGNGNDFPELLINSDARSPLAEAYRHLRTSVLLSTAGRAPRSLLVSSSMPSEGKTTTSVNMAMSFIQTGATVVIVDADMRRPRLHKIFQSENGRGLSTVLSSEMSEAEILNLVIKHEPTGLCMITAGPIPPNPAELIGSKSMHRLIKILEAHFMHVVIDSPPIASFTDSVLISTMVDGTLLVVHGGKSSLHIVRRARQIVQDVGGKVLGIVLNNMNLRSTDYYYYQQYYSHYYPTDKAVESAFSETEK